VLPQSWLQQYEEVIFAVTFDHIVPAVTLDITVACYSLDFSAGLISGVARRTTPLEFWYTPKSTLFQYYYYTCALTLTVDTFLQTINLNKKHNNSVHACCYTALNGYIKFSFV
jgi:hypothetical protein